MKKVWLYLLSGAAGGILLGILVIFTGAQSIMLKEIQSKYSFEESVQLFEKTTLPNGWKIPTVHDMQKTMESFGKTVNRGKVFELCHPVHAYEILSRDNERIVMSMMPCRVAIYEKSDGKTYVSLMNTRLMGSMMKGIVPKVMRAASKETEQLILPLVE